MTSTMRILMIGGGTGGHAYSALITIRAVQGRLGARHGRREAAEHVVTVLLNVVRHDLVQAR